MAIFYPSLDKIKRFKVQPTEGESTLLKFLAATLDESFEVSSIRISMETGLTCSLCAKTMA